MFIALKTGSRNLKNKLISRRSFLERAAFAGLSSTASIGGAVGYTCHIEPKWIQVERLTVKLPNLPDAFEDMRIAQISDLHADDFITPKDVAIAVSIINELQPSLVVVTGDYVTRESAQAFPIAEVLSRIKAPLGCFLVLGNHEYWGNVEEIVEAFDYYSLTLLRNRNQPIEKDGNRIWIAGIDDVLEKRHNLRKALENVPANETVVLLAHEPDIADQVASDERVTLQLSGHSHGGQVRIPFWGAPILPPLGRKYPWGLNQVKQMQVYTNRGLGMVGFGLPIAVRLNCRPEVTILTLKRSRL